MTLLGLTPGTARRLLSKLDEQRQLADRTTQPVTRPTTWVRFTGATFTGPNNVTGYNAVLCQPTATNDWEEFGAVKVYVYGGGVPVQNSRAPAWLTGDDANGTPQAVAFIGASLPANNLTCVRVLTWVTCNETGGLVQTFKWLTLPSAWVFDTAQAGCPAAGTP
jgi:hypothetical protein